MEVIADASVAAEIAGIVENPAHGAARQMFVLALGKLGYRESIPTLIWLLDDDEVAGHAARALGKMTARGAVPKLEGLAGVGKPWVRKEAMKALNRIAKSSASE
jgi:HEAT repeat protein